MIILSTAALLGGLFSFAVLWPYGALNAPIGAQPGATVVLFMAGVLITSQRAETEQTQERRVDALFESLSQRELSLARLDPLPEHMVKIESPITPRP